MQIYNCRELIRRTWGSTFQLEMVKVPRVTDNSTSYHCPLCRCAKFSPIGVEGKKIVCRPVVNPTGEKMECEIQPPVEKCGCGVCPICLQIAG